MCLPPRNMTDTVPKVGCLEKKNISYGDSKPMQLGNQRAHTHRQKRRVMRVPSCIRSSKYWLPRFALANYEARASASHFTREPRVLLTNPLARAQADMPRERKNNQRYECLHRRNDSRGWRRGPEAGPMQNLLRGRQFLLY